MITYDDLRAAEREQISALDAVESLSRPGRALRPGVMKAALDRLDAADALVLDCRRAIGRQNIKGAAAILGAEVEGGARAV